MTSIFCVRAGEDDEYADHFKNGNYVAIGWILDTDLSDVTEEEQIRPLYRAVYGNERSVYQISSFLLKMKAGDIVVTPSQSHEDLYIGRITYDDPSYFYSKEDDDCPYPHRRSVEWRDDPIRMKNDYKYVEMPLTRPIARELIIEEFSGKVAERQEIIDTIVKIHRDRGGLRPRGQAAGVFKKALADMKLEGKAENPSLLRRS